MELTVKKGSVSVCENRVVSAVDHTVDCDITLPEYMPDVVRVLRCTLSPCVASQQLSGDRITAECDCDINLIYICEQGKIHAFSSTEHFGRGLPVKSEDGGISVFAKTDFVNYRVSSSRKVEVHGSVSISANCMRKAENEIICEAEGDGIAVKKEKISTCKLTSFTGKPFSVSETCEIDCAENVQSVISVSHYVRTDETKAIHGKMFIKGELCVKTAVLTENCDVLCFENTVGISQIADVPEIGEDSILNAYLTVNSVSVRPRTENSGDRGLLYIDAALTAVIKCYENSEMTVIRDAYSTKYDSEIKSRDIKVYTSSEKVYDTFLCRENVDISSVGIKRVHSFSCSDISYDIDVKGSMLTASGEISADCIFEDENGDTFYVTRQIPFEYKHNSVCEDASAGDIAAAISAYGFSIGTGGTLDVRIEIQLSGLIFRESEISAITEITLDKSKCKSTKGACLTVYFADENENVWDIARHYNTTTEAIMRENKLQTEEITSTCKLLIPKI